jgi:hypothetical protein
MTLMAPIIAGRLAAFSPVSLDTLNAKAEMLDRLDNKYIVPGHQLQCVFAALTAFFDVLEIDGKRAFTYSTRYFDDAERRSYYDHHQRRRKRGKVRVRHYADAGLSFLEVKLKEQRASTTKRRLRVENPLTSLDGRCMAFVDICYRESYDEAFVKPLQSAVLVHYQRITLVAKAGGERLTVDMQLGFQANDASPLVSSELFIVETKSAHGHGIADRILRALHVQPTKHVSKYCIGMVATGQISRCNGFLQALRRLELVDSAAASFPRLPSLLPAGPFTRDLQYSLEHA